MTEQFRAFPNIRQLRFNYPVEDLTPVKQLRHLRFLQLEVFNLSANSFGFKIPSVTHLTFSVGDIETDFAIAEFLSATFRKLEVLQFEMQF